MDAAHPGRRAVAHHGVGAKAQRSITVTWVKFRKLAGTVYHLYRHRRLTTPLEDLCAPFLASLFLSLEA